MRKFASILLSVISVICIGFAFVGCNQPTISVFKAGAYETYEEIEGEPFSKAKLMIQPISKEEFDKADGINVIKNNSESKENKIYYSFELFLYDISQADYVQVKIIKLYHSDGQHLNDYDGQMEYPFDDGLLKKDFWFFYNLSNSIVNISFITENDKSCYLRFNFIGQGN